MKKVWKKPVVTVMAKGQPEETVLAACKIYEGADWTNGPGSNKCTAQWTGSVQEVCYQSGVT